MPLDSTNKPVRMTQEAESAPLPAWNLPAETPPGIPLSALFLFVAVCAVIVAIGTIPWRVVNDGDIGWELYGIAAASGGMITAWIGSALGMFQSRPVSGFFTGGMTGLVLGGLLGPLVVLPEKQSAAMFLTTLGGSTMLILISVVMRMASGKQGAD